MDVRQVARRHAPSARIIGSRTTANILGSWSGVGDRVDVVNDSAGDQRTVGRWLERAGGRVRVMALRSHHPPHFSGYTLFHGTRDTPRTDEPKWASEWLEGRTFAYLIDFMAAEDSVAFRIYYQDAGGQPPAGFAPDAVIQGRPVDVAIIAPGTFEEVDWNPEALIENLRPCWILLGHWEDFFVPVDSPTKSLRLTDLREFERRLERVFDGDWWRPDLGTEFRFPAASGQATTGC